MVFPNRQSWGRLLRKDEFPTKTWKGQKNKSKQGKEEEQQTTETTRRKTDRTSCGGRNIAKKDRMLGLHRPRLPGRRLF